VDPTALAKHGDSLGPDDRALPRHVLLESVLADALPPVGVACRRDAEFAQLSVYPLNRSEI